MRLLLISAISENKNGGLGIWTKSFLEYCKIVRLDYKLVNMDMVGGRKHNLTARRNIKDEIIRTRNIFASLNRCLSDAKYSVSHLNTACGSFGIIRDYLIAKAVNKKKIPLVIQYHCNVRDCVHNLVSIIFLKKLVNIASINIVLNNDSKDFIFQKTSISPSLLPNFIDDSVVINSKTINELVDKILYVGRVERKKGAVEIYECARRCPNKSFILVGSVSEEVSRWDKPKNLLLRGPVEGDEVIRCLDNADLFLFPSHSEGFSISLLESMARGVPSIATDVGANVDMLENKGGLIVPVGNIDSMVDGIRKLENYSDREKMSEWLIGKTKSMYTTSTVFEKLIDNYESLVIHN